MKRKFFASLVVILLIASLFSGCSSETSLCAQEYLAALGQMDFSAAFACIYRFQSADLSEEEYTAAYQTLLSTLSIEKIEITSSSIRSDSEGEYLEYTAVYHSRLAGEMSNTFQARMRQNKNGQMRIEYGPHLLLPDMEEGDRLIRRSITGTRGEILSADHEALAKNDYAQTVYLKVSDVENITQTLAELSDLVEFDKEKVSSEYQTAIDKDYGTVVVSSFKKDGIDAALEESLLAIPGVAIDETSLVPIRYYPLGAATAHLTGYLSSPNEEQQKQLKEDGFPIDTKIGSTGLESSYEETLRGKDGVAVEILDEDGKSKRTVYESEFVAGKDLVLSINSYTQELAYYSLASVLDGKDMSGVAIVMDPKTGEVEAIANYPSFDNNDFAFNIPADLWKELNSADSGQPLYSRATLGTYPPGSTFKPFTIVPVLESGVISPDTVFPYEIKDNKWTPDLKGWVYPPITRMRATRGELNLSNAMRSSDNIYFAYAALELGEEKLFSYLRKIGIGEEFSFDLPVATSNLVNDDSEKNQRLIAEMGYGQGELLITPIQLATMFTAYVNNGTMIQPTLVQSICQQDGLEYKTLEETQTTVYKENTIAQSTIDTILPMLENVVDTGTANPVKMKDVRIAAKTGTAQVGSDKSREISWIVGFWLDQPEDKLVLVMVDVPEDRGSVKFSVAKTLLNPKNYYDHSTEPAPEPEA